MKKRRCKVCKQPIPKADSGRPRLYCSAACRQKAYRKRMANPALALRAINNDLFAIRDRHARARGAVKVLEQLGFRVQLADAAPGDGEPGPRRPPLTLVKPTPDESPEGGGPSAP